VLEIYDSCLVLSAYPRLAQSPTLALIQTRDQTQIPPRPGPTPTHHPDPRVHVQGLALVRPIVKGDVEGVFRRQIVAIVDVEGRLGEDITRVKIHLTTTGGDGSHHVLRLTPLESGTHQVAFHIDYLYFVS
jgi:hypothetical protein